MIDKIKSKIANDYANGTLTPDELTSELAQLEGAGIAKGLGLPFCYTPYGDNIDYCEDIDPYVYDGRMSPEDFAAMQKMREDKHMIYQICWTEKYREKMRYASTFDTLDGYDNVECGEFPPENRKEAFDFVMDHLDDLQMFAPHETGSIYGYCVETSDGRKPTAMLIRHADAGWIWIEIG